jgi:hypothetical protein
MSQDPTLEPRDDGEQPEGRPAEPDVRVASSPEEAVPLRTWPFGARAAALAGMVAPVALVVGGIASTLLEPTGGVALYTTCCP